MTDRNEHCRDCSHETNVDRRDFLKAASLSAAGAAAAGVAAPTVGNLFAADAAKAPETIVKQLFDTLTDKQRKVVCFDWDYTEKERGLLRTRVANNWHITKPAVYSDFFTKDQQQMCRQIFEGIIHPSWHGKIDKQLKDDAGGFGRSNNIAIFGNPADGKYELVMTGRHMTIRCDGNSADHVAFGGPIFYGHAASGFNEKPTHPGNVFWEQALAANEVYKALDGKQRKLAAVDTSPYEGDVYFRGEKTDKIQGIPVSEMSSDQKELVQKTLQKLIEPYRQNDRDEALACLKAQGGIDNCKMAFYTDQDLGDDGVWDVWRLEGPSFVWHFRGAPHVHCWVNVANDPSVKLNA